MSARRPGFPRPSFGQISEALAKALPGADLWDPNDRLGSLARVMCEPSLSSTPARRKAACRRWLHRETYERTWLAVEELFAAAGRG